MREGIRKDTVKLEEEEIRKKKRMIKEKKIRKKTHCRFTDFRCCFNFGNSVANNFTKIKTTPKSIKYKTHTMTDHVSVHAEI